jgi:hypothetical protein
MDNPESKSLSKPGQPTETAPVAAQGGATTQNGASKNSRHENKTASSLSGKPTGETKVQIGPEGGLNSLSVTGTAVGGEKPSPQQSGR